MNARYLRPIEVCKIYNITQKTLIDWSDEGKIECIKTRGGHRRYLLTDIDERKHSEKKKSTTTTIVRRKICYCRVSTPKQKEDLLTQREFFLQHYPDYEIISDIGSGLNFKRKGFEAILESAIKGDVAEVVVTHRDRLCRFGFDLIENIIHRHSAGKIVVLDKGETSPNRELVNDLLSIVSVFSARLHGLRSHSLRRQIRETQESEKIEKRENIGRGGRSGKSENFENTDFSDGYTEDGAGCDV